MNTPFQNIVFRPDPTIHRAAPPRRTPGVIALRLSDGREVCLGLGGPAPGLRATELHGLTEDEAREVIERREVGALRSGMKCRQHAAGAERWAAPDLSLNTWTGLGADLQTRAAP